MNPDTIVAEYEFPIPIYSKFTIRKNDRKQSFTTGEVFDYYTHWEDSYGKDNGGFLSEAHTFEEAHKVLRDVVMRRAAQCLQERERVFSLLLELASYSTAIEQYRGLK